MANFIKRLSWLCLLITFTLTTATAHDDSDGKRGLRPENYFSLEFPSDPQMFWCK
jgi:hypothetical protein